METIEEIADRARTEDEFYIIVINEVLFDDSSPKDLRELNENLKEQLDE